MYIFDRIFHSLSTKSTVHCLEQRIVARLVNTLNAELNPICHLLALLGAHRILHISRIRVKKPLVAYGIRMFSTVFNISFYGQESAELRVSCLLRLHSLYL